jgi:hypothetical protein
MPNMPEMYINRQTLEHIALSAATSWDSLTVKSVFNVDST